MSDRVATRPMLVLPVKFAPTPLALGTSVYTACDRYRPANEVSSRRSSFNSSNWSAFENLLVRLQFSVMADNTVVGPVSAASALSGEEPLCLAVRLLDAAVIVEIHHGIIDAVGQLYGEKRFVVHVEDTEREQCHAKRFVVDIEEDRLTYPTISSVSRARYSDENANRAGVVVGFEEQLEQQEEADCDERIGKPRDDPNSVDAGGNESATNRWRIESVQRIGQPYDDDTEIRAHSDHTVRPVPVEGPTGVRRTEVQPRAERRNPTMRLPR